MSLNTKQYEDVTYYRCVVNENHSRFKVNEGRCSSCGNRLQKLCNNCGEWFSVTTITQHLKDCDKRKSRMAKRKAAKQRMKQKKRAWHKQVKEGKPNGNTITITQTTTTTMTSASLPVKSAINHQCNRKRGFSKVNPRWSLSSPANVCSSHTQTHTRTCTSNSTCPPSQNQTHQYTTDVTRCAAPSMLSSPSYHNVGYRSRLPSRHNHSNYLPSFKSQFGDAVSFPERSETPCTRSSCSHTTNSNARIYCHPYKSGYPGSSSLCPRQIFPLASSTSTTTTTTTTTTSTSISTSSLSSSSPSAKLSSSSICNSKPSLSSPLPSPASLLDSSSSTTECSASLPVSLSSLPLSSSCLPNTSPPHQGSDNTNVNTANILLDLSDAPRKRRRIA